MRVIDNPRPLYEKITPKGNARYERLEAGGTTGGIVVDITKKGLVINGYYKGVSRDTRYANTLKPVKITWEDLEKARKHLNTPIKKNKKKILEPDVVEDQVDADYLATLPIVAINDKKYYIDGKLRERRPVDNPEKVFKF